MTSSTWWKWVDPSCHSSLQRPGSNTKSQYVNKHTNSTSSNMKTTHRQPERKENSFAVWRELGYIWKGNLQQQVPHEDVCFTLSGWSSDPSIEVPEISFTCQVYNNALCPLDIQVLNLCLHIPVSVCRSSVSSFALCSASCFSLSSLLRRFNSCFSFLTSSLFLFSSSCFLRSLAASIKISPLRS